MDHTTIEQERIVDRYVLGQLSSEEAEAFEAHYFGCPACFEQVELADQLQGGLKQTAAEDLTRIRQAGFLAWLSRRSSAQRRALGLALLALILGPWAWMQQEIGRLDRQVEAAYQPLGNTLILALSPLRGEGTSGAAQRLRLDSEPRWIVLSLELGGIEHRRYRVTLLREDGAEVWRSGDLKPNPYDALSLQIHSTRLPAGEYRVHAEGSGSGDRWLPVSSFSFRVLR